MIPRRIPQPDEGQGCWWAPYGIANELGIRLQKMAQILDPLPLQLISGFRTEAEEDELRKEGRPTAPPGRSTHTSCPATGADLALPTLHADNTTKAMLGRAATFAGLRWGGGSKVDTHTGIPGDWNHVDLGPRR